MKRRCINTLGVYAIKNKVNDKVYIGESNNIERRWQEHKDELNTNSHYNKKLQSDWNKYKEENFIFEVLEEVPKIQGSPYKTTMQLIYVENKYIKQFDSITNGYNLENTVVEVLSGKKVIIKEKTDAKYLMTLIKNNGVPKEPKHPKHKSKKPNKLKIINKVSKENKIIEHEELMSCTKFAKWLIQNGYNLEQNKPNILQSLLNNCGIFYKTCNYSMVNSEYIEKGYFIYGKPSNKTKDGDIVYNILITELGKEFIINSLNLRMDKPIRELTNDKKIIIAKPKHQYDIPSFREYILNELTSEKYDLNCKYNDIFKSLRDKEYFYYNDKKHNIPQDKYINENKYFVVEVKYNNEKEYSVIYVLDEGKIFLEKYLKENNLIKPKPESKNYLLANI